MQNLRKTLALEYEQRIKLHFKTDEPVRSAVLEHKETIAAETLAVELAEDARLADEHPGVYSAEIEEQEVLIKLELAAEA